jgi:hypothetical protein
LWVLYAAEKLKLLKGTAFKAYLSPYGLKPWRENSTYELSPEGTAESLTQD